MKDELGIRIITKFVGLKTRIRIYLIDEGSEDKKGKNTKNSLATNPWSSIRILITGGSGSVKTNSLFSLISLQPDIDKIYSYA